MDPVEHLGPVAAPTAAALDDLTDRDAVRRTWDGDHTLWQDEPTEVADRLGWLHSPAEMLKEVDDLRAFAADVAAAGCTHVVLMGMGGSSLFPEVLARTFGAAAGGLELTVLDTTDPGAVQRAAATLPLDHTLFVASSKSGSTIETRSHLAFFEDLVADRSRFAAV